MPAILGPLTRKRNFGIDLLTRVIFFGCFLAALLFAPMIAGADEQCLTNFGSPHPSLSATPIRIPTTYGLRSTS